MIRWQDIHRFISKRSSLQKQTILLSVDFGVILASLFLTLALTRGPATTVDFLTGANAGVVSLVVWLCLSGLGLSMLFGLHRIKLKSYELQAVIRTGLYAATVSIAALIMNRFVLGSILELAEISILAMVLTILSVSTRLILRHITLESYLNARSRRRVLIYGAGQTGVQLAAALMTDETLEPVAFADDNLTLQRMVVAGMPVFAPIRLDTIIAQKEIDLVILAMPSMSRPKQFQIARKLESLGCEVRMLPSFASLISKGDGDLLNRVQPADPREFLNRGGLEHDICDYGDIYSGRTVLVTGAGGSIGSELCRQLIACRPSHLILFEMGEHALYQIERELRELIPAHQTRITAILGSVTDETTVDRLFQVYNINIVLHAAAYKHVPMVQKNKLAGLHNNVIGTRILAEAARDNNVSHFILVSTDKAVRPTNVMGASKRLAELVIQDLATRPGNTVFSMVRFGNVLGSSGSVIPLFSEQIARGGPITLTHSKVSRYFMTIGEAASLVLTAGDFARGGEVFVLDMGERIQIQQLARQMIERSGYSVRDDMNPDGDIEIIETGLRPGEKLHEELLIGSATRPTGHPKIMCADEEFLSELEVATALRSLQQAIADSDDARAEDTIIRWVRGYEPEQGTDRITAAPRAPLAPASKSSTPSREPTDLSV